jgi:hypothetical protein
MGETGREGAVLKWNAYDKAQAEGAAANTREREAKANLLDERRRLVAANVEKVEVQNETARRARLSAENVPRANPCGGLFRRGFIRGFIVGLISLLIYLTISTM